MLEIPVFCVTFFCCGILLHVICSFGRDGRLLRSFSLGRYEWLKKFARERIAALPRPKDKGEAATAAALSLAQGDEPFTDPGTVFKDELPMVDQMCELLPKQIDRVFHTGKL